MFLLVAQTNLGCSRTDGRRHSTESLTHSSSFKSAANCHMVHKMLSWLPSANQSRIEINNFICHKTWKLYGMFCSAHLPLKELGLYWTGPSAHLLILLAISIEKNSLLLSLLCKLKWVLISMWLFLHLDFCIHHWAYILSLQSLVNIRVTLDKRLGRGYMSHQLTITFLHLY